MENEYRMENYSPSGTPMFKYVYIYMYIPSYHTVTTVIIPTGRPVGRS